jgi:hypothetical protein
VGEPGQQRRLPRTEKPLGLDFRDRAGGFIAVEPRVWFFTDYYSISPGMVSQVAGKGAAYQIAFNDAAGTPLSGDASYKLTLPPDVPAALFWSLTLYEAENASGLATEARRFPSLGSRDKPAVNPGGYVDHSGWSQALRSSRRGQRRPSPSPAGC